MFLHIFAAFAAGKSLCWHGCKKMACPKLGVADRSARKKEAYFTPKNPYWAQQYAGKWLTSMLTVTNLLQSCLQSWLPMIVGKSYQYNSTWHLPTSTTLLEIYQYQQIHFLTDFPISNRTTLCDSTLEPPPIIPGTHYVILQLHTLQFCSLAIVTLDQFTFDYSLTRLFSN